MSDIINRLTVRTVVGTEKCILCGKKATVYHGHVIAKEKMALGNLVVVKVLAGFCDEHLNYEKSDKNGCYGRYKKKLGLIQVKY